MKERVYKSKKNKVCKMVFALSLALTLLLSNFQPITAKADDIIPPYTDLVSSSFKWVHLYIAGTSREGCNKHYLLLWDAPTVEYASTKVKVYTYSDSTRNYLNSCYLELYDSNGSKVASQDLVKAYQLSSVDGLGQWVEMSYAEFWALGITKKTGGDWLSFSCKNASFDMEVYLQDRVGNITVLHEAVERQGNATESQWNEFLEQTEDFIGYHYLTENGATLWKELRFNHVVYPYWEQDADGTRKLMIYAPYEQTIYMEKDYGFYTEHGVFDYYISAVELTDEWCIQPYAWHTDYQPDTSTPEKVFEVIALPYIKDGYGVDANAERTLRTVYSSKSDAMNAYLLDNPPPTEEPTPTIIPEPTMPPLEPSDDNMGMLNFIKEWETLFNASGNFWKIMQYTFLYVPYELIAPVTSLLSITLALIVIRMVT